MSLALVVRVPTRAVQEVEIVRNFNETDAGLDQAAGQQAALSELAAVQEEARAVVAGALAG